MTCFAFCAAMLTEVDRRERFRDEVADLGRGVAGLGLVQADLDGLHVNGLNDFQQTIQPDLAGVGVDLRTDLVFTAIP